MTSSKKLNHGKLKIWVIPDSFKYGNYCGVQGLYFYVLSNSRKSSNNYKTDKMYCAKLKIFCDEWIMFTSFDKIEPVHLINDRVATQEELNQVKSILPVNEARHITTIKDQISYINPIENIDEIRSFHHLNKFWK